LQPTPGNTRDREKERKGEQTVKGTERKREKRVTDKEYTLHRIVFNEDRKIKSKE